MISVVEALYQRVLRPILWRLDPETAHRLVLSFLAALPPRGAPGDPPELAGRLLGLAFSNPLGLAAGLDKDARAAAAWQTIGFGFAELGTITPRPQPGNPPPRLWRLPAERALINRLGFPSQGMEAAAARLERLRRRGLRIRLGLNFGPNRDTPLARVADDCAALMARLGPLADFVVINLSSPNTPGLRDWQAPAQMRSLFSTVLATVPGGQDPHAPPRPPVLVKIAPDLDAAELAAICAAVAELGLDGIVATNTTLARHEVAMAAALEGGLSGPPLKLRARAVIRELYRTTRGAVPIIGVGGVSSAEDAYQHIRAGAGLVELYTALIYEGPALVAVIKSGLVELLRRDGLRSIDAAVGASA